MNEKRHALLPVEIERVPQCKGIEWQDWCKEKGFTPLGSGRRAWISELNTYLRGSDYLVYHEGSLITTADTTEITEG